MVPSLLFLLACAPTTVQESQDTSPPPGDSSTDSAAETGIDTSTTVDTATTNNTGDPNPTLTLALLPDTQIYVESDAWNEHFLAQTRWVLDARDSLGIDFVSQLGDIVSHGGENVTSQGNIDEWNRAAAAMAILDEGGMPWATAVGNHELDQVDVLDSGYTAWAAVFGPATTGRFDDQAWFGGHSHNELNSWQTLRAGGVDFLVLHLELDIPDTAIAWAEGVMSAHPGWPTLVSTHSHLGPFYTPYLGGTGRNSRAQVRDELLGPNPQIFLLVNGHHGVEEHGEVLNDACHPVLEMSLDYASREEGGMGWLGLLAVDPASGTLTRTTYSPVLDAWEDDADSAFTVQWDWEARFSGEPASSGDEDATTVVDDYSADTSADYLLSDSYGSGGSFVVRDGEMILQPAAGNTVAAVLTAAGQRMEVGERWGVTNPEFENVMFMVSSGPQQPDAEGEYGFRFRRDTDGLRVGIYDDEGETNTDLSADPGGAITLWIERQTATTFEFSVATESCPGRTVVQTLDLPALDTVPSLYVGLQAWSTPGGEARFDDLRVVTVD